MKYYINTPVDMDYPPSYSSSDPVVYHKGLWYFWDELWQGVFGIFDTEAEAREALSKYGETL